MAMPRGRPTHAPKMQASFLASATACSVLALASASAFKARRISARTFASSLMVSGASAALPLAVAISRSAACSRPCGVLLSAAPFASFRNSAALVLGLTFWSAAALCPAVVFTLLSAAPFASFRSSAALVLVTEALGLAFWSAAAWGLGVAFTWAYSANGSCKLPEEAAARAANPRQTTDCRRRRMLPVAGERAASG
eukprot:CAMPEP_0175476554 /NCGR_PEP_ID=MMETSP0095-20121207/75989_1 /TAXON_ID=311494 /ORGANISM="Alexandrium monilatum, Strain CCMP3105" /LENGTH=196 /DNA_ID=CAMNT_0016778149 /DNA_START=10 /DNA_END=596 /DNA_ORIENTATION=-